MIPGTVDYSKKKIKYKKKPLKDFSLKTFSRRYQIPYNQSEERTFQNQSGRMNLDENYAQYYSSQRNSPQLGSIA